MTTFLPENDLQLKEAFSHIISIEGFSDYIKKISALIYDNNLDRQRLDKILNEHNITQVEDIKEDILDMLLAYINFILEDNIIAENEAANFKQLKRFFRIKEGDFYNYRYTNIENILNRQFELIYADNQINTEEALHKVGLQELFDLSYDQFLELVNREVRAALERGASPDELDTVFIKVYQTKMDSQQEG
jgi:hypothetical protein